VEPEVDVSLDVGRLDSKANLATILFMVLSPMYTICEESLNWVARSLV
jgi:hypothetical protein